MKTKREVLKTIAKQGTCVDISCHDCPYYYRKRHCPDSIQANAVLQMFPDANELLKENNKLKEDNKQLAKRIYELQSDLSKAKSQIEIIVNLKN